MGADLLCPQGLGRGGDAVSVYGCPPSPTHAESVPVSAIPVVPDSHRPAAGADGGCPGRYAARDISLAVIGDRRISVRAMGVGPVWLLDGSGARRGRASKPATKVHRPAVCVY